VPLPLKLTVWGLPAALSDILNVALRFPAADGVKVMLIVQVVLGRIAAPLHESEVLAKSAEFAPLSETDETSRSRMPVLVIVTDWAELAVLIG
jgi:hypothetical protein